jgi:hypothetical protein
MISFEWKYRTIEAYMENLRKQNMVLKKIIKRTAAPLTKNPALPIQNGPGFTYFLPVNRFGAIARAYDVVERMIKDPTKSENAVLLPSPIPPSAMQKTTTNIMEGIGQLSLRLTLENNGEKGTALSRARTQ